MGLNVMYRLRPRTFGGFRSLVHDVSALDARARAVAFSPLFRRRRLMWDVAVYTRS